MNISIFGLGYVGCVGAACLAKMGHNVIGVDVNANKVRLINEGKPTIIEEGISELCAEAYSAGRLRATTDAAEAVASTEVSFIVVSPHRAESVFFRNGQSFTRASRQGSARSAR